MISKIIIAFSLCSVFSLNQVYAEDSLSLIEGFFDLAHQEMSIEFQPKEGSLVKIAVERESENTAIINVKLHHIMIGGLDISSELKSTLESVQDAQESGRFLRGTIKSRYSLINLKPVHEMSGYFKFQNGKLYLESFTWGSFTCDGYISLSSPKEIDLTIEFESAQAADIAMFLGCSEDKLGIAGVVSGTANISGFLDRAAIKGYLIAREGFLGELEYNVVRLHFEGVYPSLKISDSSFSDSEGLSFNIDGTFDLDEGCDVSKGMSELKLSPLVYEGDDFSEWTIRRREEQGSKRMSELKYRVENEGDDGFSLKEDTGMLGVEGTIKF